MTQPTTRRFPTLVWACEFCGQTVPCEMRTDGHGNEQPVCEQCRDALDAAVAYLRGPDVVSAPPKDAA